MMWGGNGNESGNEQVAEGAAKKDKKSKEELKEGRMMVMVVAGMVVINDYMHLNEKHGKEEVGDWDWEFEEEQQEKTQTHPLHPPFGFHQFWGESQGDKKKKKTKFQKLTHLFQIYFLLREEGVP